MVQALEHEYVKQFHDVSSEHTAMRKVCLHTLKFLAANMQMSLFWLESASKLRAHARPTRHT